MRIELKVDQSPLNRPIKSIASFPFEPLLLNTLLNPPIYLYLPPTQSFYSSNLTHFWRWASIECSLQLNPIMSNTCLSCPYSMMILMLWSIFFYGEIIHRMLSDGQSWINSVIIYWSTESQHGNYQSNNNKLPLFVLIKHLMHKVSPFCRPLALH